MPSCLNRDAVPYSSVSPCTRQGEHCGRSVAVRVVQDREDLRGLIRVGLWLYYFSTCRSTDKTLLEVLQGGRDVETPSASEHITAGGGDDV